MSSPVEDKIVSVSYDRGKRLHPRAGVLGKLIDKVFPRYRQDSTNGFIATTGSGKIITSKDGVTWGN